MVSNSFSAAARQSSHNGSHAMGCSHWAPLRQTRPIWPPWHSQFSRGLWTWWGFAHPSALWGTPIHCLGLFHSMFFSPSRPLGLILILLFPIFCSLGMIPHFHLFLISHTAWEYFWSLQNTNHGGQTKGLSQIPCTFHFTGNFRWNSHVTVQVYTTDQKVTVSLLPIAHFAETCWIYPLIWETDLIPSPPSASSPLLKFMSSCHFCVTEQLIIYCPLSSCSFSFPINTKALLNNDI